MSASAPSASYKSILERLQADSSLEQTWTTAVEYFRAYDLTHVSYVYFQGPDFSSDHNVMLSTIPESWVQLYRENEAQLTDAFYTHCCNTLEGTKTGLAYMDDFESYSIAERNLIRHVAQTGFTAGASFVMESKQGDTSFGGWNLGGNFAREEFDALYDSQSESLGVVCLYFHERLRRFSSQDVEAMQKPRSVVLSPRQTECLQLLASGLRIKDIARELCLSAATVELHLKLARESLDATTREQAVARAVVQGLILPL